MVILELLMTMEPHGERPVTRQAQAGLPDRPDSLLNSGVHYWKLLSCCLIFFIFTHCAMLIFYESVNFTNSYHFTTLIYFGGRFNFNCAGELAVFPLCCKIRKNGWKDVRWIVRILTGILITPKICHQIISSRSIAIYSSAPTYKVLTYLFVDV